MKKYCGVVRGYYPPIPLHRGRPPPYSPTRVRPHHWLPHMCAHHWSATDWVHFLLTLFARCVIRACRILQGLIRWLVFSVKWKLTEFQKCVLMIAYSITFPNMFTISHTSVDLVQTTFHDVEAFAFIARLAIKGDISRRNAIVYWSQLVK